MTIDEIIFEIKKRLEEAEHMYSVYYTFKNMHMVEICQTEIDLYKDFLEYLKELKENR